MEHLRNLIREVPDFPKPGINFYDITTLLLDPEGLRNTIDALVGEVPPGKIDTVIGVESRGFIFATPIAYQLNAGFIPVRKPKKLPAEKVSISYDLEYGQDTLEMHKDAVGEGHRVLIGVGRHRTAVRVGLPAREGEVPVRADRHPARPAVGRLEGFLETYIDVVGILRVDGEELVVPGLDAGLVTGRVLER